MLRHVLVPEHPARLCKKEFPTTCTPGDPGSFSKAAHRAVIVPVFSPSYQLD